MNRLDYIRNNQINKRVAERLAAASELSLDALEVAAETLNSFKYVTDKGEVRLDISFDLFGDILYHAIKHNILCQTYVLTTDEEYKTINERLKSAWRLSCINSLVLDKAVELYRVEPLFDDRNKKTP